MWKILSLSSCHKASLGGIRHSRHVGNSCQLLIHTLFKIAFWAVSTQSNVQIYLPRSIILDVNGEYFCVHASLRARNLVGIMLSV